MSGWQVNVADGKSRTGRRVRLLIVLTVVVGLAASLGGRLVETVASGTYQVKQAAVTGNMSAKMDPGLWFQNFGDIMVWKKAETFYFTADLHRRGRR